MVHKLAAALAVIAIGTVGVSALILNRARAENGNGVPCDPNIPILQTIGINVNPLDQGGASRFWTFDATYKNNSCLAQDVAIIMQVKDETDKVISLQSRELFLSPGVLTGFQWNFIFLKDQRVQGRNKIEFFVWKSLDNPVPISRPVTVTI